LSITDAEMHAAFAELDNYESAAVSVDKPVWERFVEFRRQKIAMEASLRLKAISLNEMSLYLQKRIEDDEQKRREIDECSKSSMGYKEIVDLYIYKTIIYKAILFV
jgi:hypothetical protein